MSLYMSWKQLKVCSWKAYIIWWIFLRIYNIELLLLHATKCFWLEFWNWSQNPFKLNSTAWHCSIIAVELSRYTSIISDKSAVDLQKSHYRQWVISVLTVTCSGTYFCRIAKVPDLIRETLFYNKEEKRKKTSFLCKSLNIAKIFK